MSVRPDDGQRSFYHTDYLAGNLFSPTNRYRLFREKIWPKLLELGFWARPFNLNNLPAPFSPSTPQLLACYLGALAQDTQFSPRNLRMDATAEARVTLKKPLDSCAPFVFRYGKLVEVGKYA